MLKPEAAKKQLQQWLIVQEDDVAELPEPKADTLEPPQVRLPLL